MSRYHSEREEKLLEQLLEKYQALGIVVWGEIEGAPGTYAKILVKSDGTVKVEGIVSISGSVDVSDRWARQLGQIDIARYLGSAMGVANPLHSQIVYGGVVIDPRDVSDRATRLVGKIYGNQGQPLEQRATTFDLMVQLRQLGVEIDPRDRNWTLGVSDVPDLSDRATRLLGVVYGSQGQQILQRATTYDLIVQLRAAGVEYDARSIRALTASDIVTAVQATRTSLKTQPEREDLVSLGGAVNITGGSGTQIIAGVSGQYVKVFDAGYDALTAGLHYFYFGTSSTPTTRRLLTRQSGTGAILKSFSQPRKGDLADGLWLYSSVSETNLPYDVGYVQEA